MNCFRARNCMAPFTGTAFITLAVVFSAWPDEPDSPRFNFAGTAGFPPGRQIDNVHARISIAMNRAGVRFVDIDVFIGKIAPDNLKPPAINEEFELTYPLLKKGEELPLGNRVLTISNIAPTTARGGELVQFEDSVQYVESGNFIDYFALLESTNEAGLRCKSGSVCVRKIAGSVKESGRQAKHAEVQITVAGKTEDRTLFIGDKFNLGKLRFKIGEIVSTSDTGRRYGWVILERY
ncbi:hypothetical protein [Anatilimnocola floriformis]|uniref:hypothetical protein n=1 Tax=Anatilimnocola floriformis TaxID=2948575 RepID=UPI0020C25E07|nr:hypothetical protein [Anatilimnocola floriformis]